VSDGTAYGIDVGGTKVLGVALDADDRVVAEVKVPTSGDRPGPLGPTGDDVAAAVVDVVVALGDRVPGTGDSERRPVGVGVPGMVDRLGGLRFAPNLPGAAGTDFPALIADRLAERLTGRLTAPLAPRHRQRGSVPSPVVENDANLALWAEHRLGAARGVAQVLMVTLGTGIGGAIVVDDRVLTGAHGFAAEVGHMVVDPTGPPCPCGRRGCWERFASGSGLGRLAREAAHAGSLGSVVALAGGDPEDVRGEHVTGAALAGDEGARSVVEELGRWVALGLANLTALLDPTRIVVGGGLAEAGELLLEPTRRAFAGIVHGGASRPPVEIVAAELGERAGAVGAALAARAGGLPT
jgi:glucokinase